MLLWPSEASIVAGVGRGTPCLTRLVNGQDGKVSCRMCMACLTATAWSPGESELIRCSLTGALICWDSDAISRDGGFSPRLISCAKGLNSRDGIHRMLCHCHCNVINVFPWQLPAEEKRNKIPPARKAESQVQSQASVSRICRSRNGGHARCWSRGYPRRIHSLRLNGSVSTNAETGSTLEKIWR